jgi:hypothetical protein
MLRAGPCEDCETSKILSLTNCKTDFETNNEKCFIDAKTAQAICVNNEQGAIEQAATNRDAAMKTAIGAYYIAIAVCAVLPPPAPLPCLYTASGGYAAALGKANLDYQKELGNAATARATCDKNCQEVWKGCLDKADDEYSKCVKKAVDAYNSCKTNCNGA